MGVGIREVMFRCQARRYLPLPDYDFSDPNHVVLRLPGRFIDENYSRALIVHPDLSLDEILALDNIQKGRLPDDAMLAVLRKKRLVEGSKPRLRVSALVAMKIGEKMEYIQSRHQDDAFYRKFILDLLRERKEASTRDIRDSLWTKLPAALSVPQKENKIRNLLAGLKREGAIHNTGTRRYPRWTIPIAKKVSRYG